MKKVSRDEFFRMPAGTLYSIVKNDDPTQEDGLYIKMDNGEPYDGGYVFNGAILLTPSIPIAGADIKWLYEYRRGEEIKSEIEYSDESSADFYDYEEVLVYDKEEVKRIIDLLQKICIENCGKDKNELERLLGEIE